MTLQHFSIAKTVAKLGDLLSGNDIYRVANLPRDARYCSFWLLNSGSVHGNSERGKLGARTSAKFARQFVQLCWF